MKKKIEFPDGAEAQRYADNARKNKSLTVVGPTPITVKTGAMTDTHWVVEIDKAQVTARTYGDTEQRGVSRPSQTILTLWIPAGRDYSRVLEAIRRFSPGGSVLSGRHDAAGGPFIEGLEPQERRGNKWEKR